MNDAVAHELLEFWDRERGFGGEEARRRLDEVVCVLRRDGAIAGSNSVYAADLPLIGGRRFWVYRSLLSDAVAGEWPALIKAVYETLDAEYDADADDAPSGLCVLLTEHERRARPEADWIDPRLIHAGYLADGRQVRVAYFSQDLSDMKSPRPDAGWGPGEGYAIEPFAAQDAVSAADVVALWTSEGVLPPAEAERRVAEVLLVATDEQQRPVGISSAYLSYNDQLRAHLWYYRAFVAAAHRHSNIAVSLAVMGRDHLEQRFVRGEDRRGIGVIYEVENESLKQYFPRGRWMPTDFLFIGHNDRGDHVRVHYFPGALAPEPDAPAQGSA
jgi:hypothetical protein